MTKKQSSASSGAALKPNALAPLRLGRIVAEMEQALNDFPPDGGGLYIGQDGLTAQIAAVAKLRELQGELAGINDSLIMFAQLVAGFEGEPVTL